jgi:hypothetical protein
VPREYNGAYGTNGFNLTFAADTIVSSANFGDWANQLFTAPGDDLSTINYNSTDTNFLSGSPAINGFNGSTSTFVQSTTDTSWIFRPTNPIPNVTEIRIQVTNAGAGGGNTGGQLALNGTPIPDTFPVNSGSPFIKDHQLLLPTLLEVIFPLVVLVSLSSKSMDKYSLIIRSAEPIRLQPSALTSQATAMTSQ